MKKQREGKKHKNAPSRRGFIKGVAGGLALSLASDLTPVANALGARKDIQAERDLITCTIGETTRRLMDSSIQTSPDLPVIYQGLGGTNPVTIQILAQTFGSPSMNIPGAYTLQPGSVPNFSMLTAALSSKIRASAGQSGVTVTILRRGQPSPANATYRVADVEVRDITINCN
jgi:hypothetical protein